MNLKVFSALIILSISLCISCQNEIDKSESIPLNPEKELSLNAVKEFNKVISKLNLNGKISEVKSVYSYLPKFDETFYSHEEISNYYFFRLESKDMDTSYIAADRNGHFIIVSRYIGDNIYLDESVTFNLDLNFLKFEHGVVPFEIEGKLEDTSIWYRETSFDKRLIGNWVLDSISPQIKFRFSETKSWNFSKPDAVSIMDDYRKSDSYVNPPTLTIDSTEFNYRTIGPLMEIMSKTDTIQLFRFSISNRGLILLDNYNKEKQILMFFRKK